MTELLARIEHPAIDVELAYAHAGNFTGRAIYDSNIALLHADAAKCLYAAAVRAERRDLRIRLLDAYRPASVQALFWKIRPDARFVADPDKGSDHTRGIAVDVTLTDRDHRPLDMGSEFDEASPASFHGAPDVSPAAHRNRDILLSVMEGAGFSRLPTEWWHYSLPDPERYGLIDRAAA